VNLFFEMADSPVSANPTPHYLSSVKTCVYEPSELRVLVTWLRAPMYSPVPPKTGRMTGLPASNSGNGRRIIGSSERNDLVFAFGKGKEHERGAPLQIRVRIGWQLH